jgi:two-component system OmpR family response regulator
MGVMDVGLVIEDDEDIRWVIATVLSHAGLHVRMAATGEEGLRLARDLQPLLITLDLGLPDVDGLDILPRIREASYAPVIVLSARNPPERPYAALGIEGYLRKPFRLHELHVLVQELLN